MKRGQAEFIGWVLLIGFAVVLAAFVGNWVIQQARETAEGMVDMTTKDLKCADVSISISFVTCEEGKVLKIGMVNTGYFTIQKVACYTGKSYTTHKFEDFKPGKTKTLSYPCASVVPIIEVDSKTIGCSEKQVEVKCK